MNKASLLFAKTVVYLVALAALAVCVLLLPELAREEMVGKPKSADITLPFLAVSYTLASPFFVALYQTQRLLRLIEKNKAFSQDSVNVLSSIKLCAVIFGLLVLAVFVGGGIALRFLYPQEDAPPFFILGFVLAFTSGVIAVSVAVLQKLLKDAVALKSENDLII